MNTVIQPGESLSQIAYDALLSQIVDRTLRGGAIIQERKVAAALGISRTPMRMALARLEGEGYLTRLTDRLLSVRLVSLSECLDAIGIRKLIEPEATRLATPKISQSVIYELKSQLTVLMEAKEPSVALEWAFDDNLHGTIANYSGNLAMYDTITRLRRTTKLFEQMKVPEPSSLSHGGQEHLNILEFMECGDPEKAAEAMYEHLDKSCDGILGRI